MNEFQRVMLAAAIACLLLALAFTWLGAQFMGDPHYYFPEWDPTPPDHSIRLQG